MLNRRKSYDVVRVVLKISYIMIIHVVVNQIAMNNNVKLMNLSWSEHVPYGS